MRKHICLLIGVLFLWCFNVQAQPSEQHETLRGLSGVTLVVEPLNPEVEQDGLTGAQLYDAVEEQLLEADINVLSQDDVAGTFRQAYLYINVAALKKHYGLYAYAIEVSVNQRVSLMRDNAIQQFAETWESREVGTVGTEKLSTIQESVAMHVGAFVDAYRAANPEQDGRVALVEE